MTSTRSCRRVLATLLFVVALIAVTEPAGANPSADLFVTGTAGTGS